MTNSIPKCVACGTELTDDNAHRRPGLTKSGTVRSYFSWCKPCDANRVQDRQRANKLRAVDYLGGSCQRCGYNKCVAALEFHHRDPSTKDHIYRAKASMHFKWGWERLQKELDKCDLLCANCHREVEYMT